MNPKATHRYSIRLLLAGIAAFITLPQAQAVIHPPIYPGPDAQEKIQEALITAKPGDVVVLAAGRFTMTDGLSLAVDNISVQGAGRNITILDFSGQETAGEGLLVTSDQVTLRQFSVLNTKSDGIKAQGCKNITLQHLHVEWTRGPHTENGAYGLYPVQCEGVLIEHSVVKGASDAGIYVGQSERIVVRDNRASLNVAGLEIENSNYADVYNNLLEQNTGGILVFDLPNLDKQGGGHVRVFNNRSVNNNTDNFGAPGTSVAGIPRGTGVMVMANTEVEIFGNFIGNNNTANLLVVSYQEEYSDDSYQPLPRHIHIHNNRFTAGGDNPDSERAAPIEEVTAGPVPDIVWDGVTGLWDRLMGRDNQVIVLGENNSRPDGSDATFVNLDLIPWAIPGLSLFHAPDHNADNYRGVRASLPEVELEF